MNRGIIHRMLMDATLYFIYYTSSDGNIVIPGYTLGRNVKSNAYIDGLGIMVCYNPITSLNSFSRKTTLTGIVIPEGIISISSFTFNGCTNLTSITIPSSVNQIDASAFKGCDNLKVYISDLSSWCKIDFYNLRETNPLNDTASLYLNGSLVTDLVIPSDITEIKPRAFYNYKKLKSITIPEGVISISKDAFNYCVNVTSITIPSSLTSVEKGALLSNRELKVYISDLSSWCKIDSQNISSSGNKYLYLNGNIITDLAIPSDITEIKPKSFYYYKNITSVTIPNSVTFIGELAFSHCVDLNAFYGKFASSDNKCLIVDGSLIQAVYKLSSYNIPENVTSIGSYAFYNNNLLTSVTISDSVISINDYAFCLCTNLTSVVIPESVTSIRLRAFAECYFLTSIVIPENVTSIGEGAFGWCNRLENIYCKRPTPPTGNSSMFYTTVSTLERKIYVPIDSVSLYKEAEYWSDYADYIVGYDFESNNV